MKILHTSDWHVGKVLRGRSRADEHRQVLAEIAEVARREQVDIVLVAGDLFDTATPSPESEAVVYQALLDLADSGARVVVISGNHDNERRLEAVAPLLDLGRVTVCSKLARAQDGGVVELTTDGGETALIALIPFQSQRNIVRATDLMELEAFEHGQKYEERISRVVDLLCQEFRSDTVNLVVGHLMVLGGNMGGGERGAHTVFDYCVSATAFPGNAHYVALGHLHRSQKLAAACPVWYCGSPLQLDFGETEDEKSVLLIDVAANRPAEVSQIPLASGHKLRTIRGTLAELEAFAAEMALVNGGGADGALSAELSLDVEGIAVDSGDPVSASDSVSDSDSGSDETEPSREVPTDYLRVFVREKPQPGLADRVRELFPNAVDIVVESERNTAASREGLESRRDKSERELFAQYLTETGATDDSLLKLFDEVLEEVYASS